MRGAQSGMAGMAGLAVLGVLFGPCVLGYTPFIAIRRSFRCAFLNPGDLPMHTQDALDD